ncbi:MAG: monovalent cation/H+ antiporter subunit D family protein [Hyphomicrobiaceae bacterium]
MSSISSHLPVLQVLLPLFGALITAFMRRGSWAWSVTLVISWLLPVMAGAMLWQVMTSDPVLSYHMGGWEPPFGIEYRIDKLGAFVIFVVSLMGAVTLPFARRSVADEVAKHNQAWYYTMYLLCLAGLLGIAATGDAFNAFVFLEVSSLATYVLIAMGPHRRSLLAAYQYLIMGTIGATLYVIGIGGLYLATGSLNFADISSRLSDASGDQMRTILMSMAFIITGVSLKLALFPLHVWLPNAYAYAPSFATSFLAGTATKVAICLLLRMLFSVFGAAIAFSTLPVQEIFLVLSVAAMFVASLAAVFEQNVKRMLAYSSVAQIGYITLGIALANQSGLTGSLVHILNHAVMKTALFLALGAIAYQAGVMRLGSLAGIGRKMPITMAAFVVAGLGLMGVPGTAGFVSKWYLAVGAIDAGMTTLVFLIVASSLLAVVYIGRVVEVAYFREPSTAVAETSDPPWSMLLPLLVLAAATIYLGLDTSFSVGVAGSVAEALLGGLK